MRAAALSVPLALALATSGCLASPGAARCPEPAPAAAAAGAAAPTPDRAAGPIAPETEHPFSVLDMLAMDRISDLQVSPDGRRGLFTLRTTDLAADKGRTDIWSIELESGTTTRLTSHDEADFGARFSADGQAIYFVSTRSGAPQIHALSGPEQVRAITTSPVGAQNLVVSPDGRSLAFTADVFVDCPDLACTERRLAEQAARPARGQVHDRLFVRHWDTWKDGRRSHLFVIPVEGGAPIDVASGLDADVPSKPFGGAEEIAFSRDGRLIVFTARDAGRGEAWSTNFDLFVAPVDGSTPPRRITENPAWDTQPVFSPDGTRLAYLAMKRPGFEADRFRVVVRDWPDGQPRVLTEDWDRSVHELRFAPDGKTLLATADDLGQVALFAIGVEDGAVRRLVADASVGSPAPAGARAVFLKNDLAHPDEIWSVGLDGSGLRVHSHVNDQRVARARMGTFEPFSFRGAGGDTVHGYLVAPVARAEGQKVPIALLVHGGPQGSMANKFHYRWNPQVYAGAGYAALMIDFHGSTGYGQAFTDAISRDWGGKPLVDLQKGLSAALARWPWLDGERACALGGSYGGFMINWIAGKWPDRFDCLVNHDGVFDQRSMYYSTEELWFPEWDFGGPYFERPGLYEKFNPAAFVSRWKTPMLVIHGGLDFRVPLEQGLATFTALQRRGVESRFLHFPDENHWVLRPHDSIQWHNEVLRWLAEHLRAQEEPAARPRKAQSTQ